MDVDVDNICDEHLVLVTVLVTAVAATVVDKAVVVGIINER